MDFSFTEEQETVGKVARQLFEHRATPEHLAELESGENRFDAALWTELASSDLLGIALPESAGGSGGNFLELGVLLAEVGWSVAPVPLYATLVLGADTIARHGDSTLQDKYLSGVADGSTILTAALAESGNSEPTSPRTTAQCDGDVWRLDGTKQLVPAAQLANAIVVSARTDDGPALFVVDTDAHGVDVTPVRTTHGEPHADVALTGAVGQRLGSDIGAEPLQSLYTRALVGLCAIQVGVAERALRIAASYTSEREQFGRPIGSFQAVKHLCADMLVAAETARAAVHAAAVTIDQPGVGDPDRAAAGAGLLAAEAAIKNGKTSIQVHGGMGFTWEVPAHLYLMRARVVAEAIGPVDGFAEELAEIY